MVPPRQVEPEIGRASRAATIEWWTRCMSGVDHDPPQPAVDARGQPDIAVAEHRRRVEQDFEDHHRHRGRAERHHRAQLDDHRQQDFERMEADPGGHVDLDVAVVHAMQPPQQGIGVEQHVLGVDDEVEQPRRRRGSPATRARQAGSAGPSHSRRRPAPRRPPRSGRGSAPAAYRRRRSRHCPASGATVRPRVPGAAPALPTPPAAPARRRRRLAG